jgi:outer membrane murein-binding lipoprotein Lpp
MALPPLPSFNLPSVGQAPKVIVAVLVLAGGGITFSMMLSKQRQQANQIRTLSTDLAASQDQVAQLEAKNRDMLAQMSTLQAERKGMEERVEALRKQLTDATDELKRVNVRFEDFQLQYEQLEGERGQLQSRLAEVISEREAAQQRGDHLAADNAKLERTVGRMRERINLLDRDYRQISKKLSDIESSPRPGLNVLTEVPASAAALAAQSAPSVLPAMPGLNAIELPPIVVRKDQSAIASPVRGRLVEVNDSHNFVVVDQGSQDGVRVGMAFDIVRGASTVGRATVVRVRPNLSACDIVRAKTPGPLQSGDLAVQVGL